MIMILCTKHYLSNIWTSVHEKVKQHWGWVAYKKKSIPFFGKLGPKIQCCQFKLKPGTYTNLVQKIKIVSLSWNLALRLTQFEEFNGDAVWWWFSFYSFFRLEILFLD